MVYIKQDDGSAGSWIEVNATENDIVRSISNRMMVVLGAG